MPAQTSMLHVRVDDQLKAQAADALAGVGLTLSDAVRILLTRVATEGGLPAGTHGRSRRLRCVVPRQGSGSLGRPASLDPPCAGDA